MLNPNQIIYVSIILAMYANTENTKLVYTQVIFLFHSSFTTIFECSKQPASTLYVIIPHKYSTVYCAYFIMYSIK